MTDSFERPLITFALFAYNQERFIAKAIQGALLQTYSPLEIILSDDCSSDRTFEIMKQLAADYQGPHTVVLNRNEKNLGLTGHINRVMEMVKGELIVVAAGDDISFPQRTEALYAAYVDSGQVAHSLYSEALRIDEAGNTLGYLENRHDPARFTLAFMAWHQVAVTGSTHAWRRDVFDVFGPIDTRVIGEDVVIPFRASLLGSIVFVDQPLVAYRYHDNNMWQHPHSVTDHGVVRRWHEARHEQRLTNLQAIWESRLKELDTYSVLHGDADIQRVRMLTEVKLTHILLERQFHNGTLREQVSILWSGLRCGIPISRLLRWILQYSNPERYYWLVGSLRRVAGGRLITRLLGSTNH